LSVKEEASASPSPGAREGVRVGDYRGGGLLFARLQLRRVTLLSATRVFRQKAECDFGSNTYPPRSRI
jgi:hypothetical protein